MKVKDGDSPPGQQGSQMTTVIITTVRQGEFVIWENEDGSLGIRSDNHNLIIKPEMTNRVSISQ